MIKLNYIKITQQYTIYNIQYTIFYFYFLFFIFYLGYNKNTVKIRYTSCLSYKFIRRQIRRHPQSSLPPHHQAEA